MRDHASYLRVAYRSSERRACDVLTFGRSTCRYEIEFMVSSHDLRLLSMSYDTAIAEALLVGRRLNDGEGPTGRGRFVNLWRTPYSETDALALVRALIATSSIPLHCVKGGAHSTDAAPSSVLRSCTDPVLPDIGLPSGLTGNGTTRTSVTLGLDAASVAHWYMLERSPDGATGWFSADAGPGEIDETAYTVTGLESETAYHLRASSPGDWPCRQPLYNSLS